MLTQTPSISDPERTFIAIGDKVRCVRRCLNVLWVRKGRITPPRQNNKRDTGRSQIALELCPKVTA